ncbi:hypothetical protein [Fimbriiglobus ruber]|uniref:Uncharacterized protein n=1 Tax=Fimbriiglobus ruber TaxID=1908690 RepID=A0A225CZT7_9BACT|nr:hypothetical protein [Fimbriiglobus ruber]OWK34870.1 hypothetical protein FRUB_09712 [Fimbriiglobus ruber]
MRLTLRTLLAYLDDTLDAQESKEIGQKLAENPPAQELVDRIRRVTRTRTLSTPTSGAEGGMADPNKVAEYLSDALHGDIVAQFEAACLEADVSLAEVAACHQILTLVLTEQMHVPPPARRRMYQLVKGRESVPDREPGLAAAVGGALEDKKPNESDDADAAYLLGMSAYSRSDSWSRLGLRLAAVAALLALFAVAVWFAVPAAHRTRTEAPRDYASLPATVTTPKSEPAPSTKSSDKGAAPDTGLKTKTDAKKDEPKKDEPLKPDENPKKDEPKKDEPPKAVAPKKDEKIEAAIPPPSADRAQIGKLEKITGVVVRKQAGPGAWTRVMPDQPEVISADRLMSLPGYKSQLRLDSDVLVELWGNLPDLLPAPLLLQSCVVPSVPGPGFDADLTIESGRIYLGTKRQAGAKIRLRFRSEVWDLTLADEKSEVVFELTNILAPGAATEAPRAFAGVAVQSGRVGLKGRGMDAGELPTGGEARWDSRTGKTDVLIKPDPSPLRTAYLAKFPVYPDPQRAKAVLTVLDDFARKISEPMRVRATFDEALQDSTDTPTQQIVLAARAAVFMFAALGDLSGLTDALNDPNRPLIRETAVDGLRSALAADPKTVEDFRKFLIEKSRLSDDQADQVLRLLRGLTDRERNDPDTLNRLVDGLASQALPVRELSFHNLASLIDPKDPTSRSLLGYDAEGPVEVRDKVVKAWKKKIEDLKNGPAEPPSAPAPTKKK